MGRGAMEALIDDSTQRSEVDPGLLFFWGGGGGGGEEYHFELRSKKEKKRFLPCNFLQGYGGGGHKPFQAY